MAKRKRRKRSKSYATQRDYSTPKPHYDHPRSTRVLRPWRLRRKRIPSMYLNEFTITHRPRAYGPSPISVAAERKKHVRFEEHLTRSQKMAQLYSQNYRLNTVCKRRSERRKTLFSRGHAGKGQKVSSIRKMTPDSKVRC